MIWTDLISSDRVEEGRDTAEEGIDPPSGEPPFSDFTFLRGYITHDMLTTRPRPKPVKAVISLAQSIVGECLTLNVVVLQDVEDLPCGPDRRVGLRRGRFVLY
jgi:hypothetical protein